MLRATGTEEGPQGPQRTAGFASSTVSKALLCSYYRVSSGFDDGVLRPYLDPKKPTFLGFLVIVSLYRS